METSALDTEKKERNTAFGKRLKAYRQSLHITQDELAEIVHRSTETISKIERGLIYPSVDMLILISQALNVTLDELVGVSSAKHLSSNLTNLLAEASTAINGLNEETLTVAVAQLKALATLSR